MIRAIDILPGDRVGIRAHGKSIMRTVIAVGDTYVTIHAMNRIGKVPEHQITSHIKSDDSSLGRRYGA